MKNLSLLILTSLIIFGFRIISTNNEIVLNSQNLDTKLPTKTLIQGDSLSNKVNENNIKTDTIELNEKESKGGQINLNIKYGRY